MGTPSLVDDEDDEHDDAPTDEEPADDTTDMPDDDTPDDTDPEESTDETPDEDPDAVEEADQEDADVTDDDDVAEATTPADSETTTPSDDAGGILSRIPVKAIVGLSLVIVIGVAVWQFLAASQPAPADGDEGPTDRERMAPPEGASELERDAHQMQQLGLGSQSGQ